MATFTPSAPWSSGTTYSVAVSGATNAAGANGLLYGNPSFFGKQLVAAMHAHPRLIQRPIVLANGKAAIGRPAENVLAIL